MIQTSSKRALMLVISATLLVGALASYATLILPEYQIVLNLRGGLASKENILAKQQTVAAQVQNVIAEYRSVERLSDSLLLALPDGEGLSSVFGQINAISQSAGLTVQAVGVSYLSIRPMPNNQLSSARGLGTLRLDLRLFGNYASLKRFLQFLETNIRIMDVKALRMEAASRTDQDLFSYLLTVDTYYQTN